MSEIDNPAPLPGKTVPETASFNHGKKLAGLGVRYKTDWLLRIRCRDRNSGVTGRGSELWRALNEYYTDPEIETIADECDGAIAAIPGGCGSI